MDCFCETQEKKKSCICPLIALKQDKIYYCSLCDECHGLSFSVICKTCMKKQEELSEGGGNHDRKRIFLGGLIGGVLGITIGFFLGWLILVKLGRKKKT